MKTAPRLIPSLVPLALLLACGTESPELAFELQANRFASSEWSDPVNLGPVVNSSANDANAALSPDEHTMYFVSNRPGSLGETDIWASHRQCLGCPWATPQNLGTPINSTAADASPTLSADGRLLCFFSGRPGGGGLDIYVSHRSGTSAAGDVWGPPINLGPDVNTAGAEQGVHYSREGGTPTAGLYFNRIGPSGTGDIFHVFIDNDGVPLGPTVLLPELSDPLTADQKVTVRNDGLELLLSSLRAGTFGNFDIWSFTRQTPRDPWSGPSHFDAPLNTGDIDSQPSLWRDGRTLIFTSNRLGGSGGNDLWMSTRTNGAVEVP
jgi:hypothetical protein